MNPGRSTPPIPARRPSRWEPRALPATRGLADVLALLAGFAISYHLYVWTIGLGLLDRVRPSASPYLEIAAVFAAIALCVFWQLGLYRGHASLLNLWELRTTVKGIFLSAAFFFAFLFFLKLTEYSRLVVVGAIVVGGTLVIIERRILSAIIRQIRLLSRQGRRTLIYGCDDTGRLLMKKIIQAPHLGCTIAGFLDDTVPIGSAVYCRIAQSQPIVVRTPVLGTLENLDDLVQRYHVDELLVAARSVGPGRLHEIFRFCRDSGLRIGVVPHLGEFRVDRLEFEDLSAIPILRPCVAASRRLYLVGKRLLDFGIALALLVVSAPVWIAAAIAIRVDTPGPILFKQTRVGLNGRLFRMFKFRTMWADTDPYAASPLGDDHDPRITPVGRILRIGGLDELPQLLNVLLGQMSLVGPRPEMPFIVERYSPLERQRLRVKPGITGLWQLSADRHAEIHQNIEYDLYYIDHRSLLLDILILLETALFTLGALVRSLLDRRTSAGLTVLSEIIPAPEAVGPLSGLDAGPLHDIAVMENGGRGDPGSGAVAAYSHATGRSNDSGTYG